ncbi:hypothetical protein Tco_1412467 [Tanacetum coccineum]
MSPVVDEPVVVAGNNKGTEDGNVGHGVTLITIIAPNTGCVPYTIHDSPTTDNYALIRSGPTSYAKLVTGEPSSKSVNFRTLIAPARNLLLGIFLRKRVAYPVFSSKDGLDAMSSYARAMIELRADEELKDTIVVTMPKLVIKGIYMCTIRVKYEWKPLRCSCCKVFDHIVDEYPKKIVSYVVKNLKNHRHAARGVEVGPKSAGKGFLNVVSGISSNTPIIEKIDKLERQILDGKLMFMVDDRKPLYRRWVMWIVIAK